MAHQSNSPHAAASDTRLGLAATVERLRSGALTSEQLTRDLLERIARYDLKRPGNATRALHPATAGR
jgi:Asp-tRNA(Asn)/Glu-tRNA(Gln) amidotransferase A subunit family amidase